MAARRFRVVLADDNADLRFLVRAALEDSTRFEVLAEARDGGEAIALAEQFQPDVLLLDLAMPVASGLEAIGPIRDVAPHTRIVVLSNFSRDRLGPTLIERGAVGYLEKRRSMRNLPDELLALAGLLEVADDALLERGVHLPADLVSPAAARRFVEETLAQWDCSEALETVKLLVSEVVANAVVHASSEVRVEIRLLPEAIRVVIGDTDPTTPTRRDPSLLDESGRGLALVEAMSTAWGVDSTGRGKDVWFEVPRFDRARGRSDAAP
jgi:DNA-binding NarL/FixJ family response regulator